MGVVIEGIDELERKLAEAELRYRGAADRFLKQQAELLLGTVRGNTPTKTKQIALAWARTQPHDNMIDVYNNTKYAAHVEYGHQQKKRWVPGEWKGTSKDRQFVYKKGAKTGMMLQEKTIPGVKMLRKSVLQQKAMFRANAKAILGAMFK